MSRRTRTSGRRGSVVGCKRFASRWAANSQPRVMQLGSHTRFSHAGRLRVTNALCRRSGSRAGRRGGTRVAWTASTRPAARRAGHQDVALRGHSRGISRNAHTAATRNPQQCRGVSTALADGASRSRSRLRRRGRGKASVRRGRAGLMVAVETKSTAADQKRKSGTTGADVGWVRPSSPPRRELTEDAIV